MVVELIVVGVFICFPIQKPEMPTSCDKNSGHNAIFPRGPEIRQKFAKCLIFPDIKLTNELTNEYLPINIPVYTLHSLTEM